MSYELIIDQCSPTMAGLKTGSMFNCPVGDMKEFTYTLRNFNKTCSGKGVRILPLKISGGNALVYMYRPSKLRNDLSDKRAASLLKSRNYPTEKCEGCLLELIKRLRSGGDFPHEVGLFLGYPPEDVYGFIKSRAKHAKAVGTWKVYGDCSTAAKRFKQYEKCTKVYRECFKNGSPFEKLIVRS